MTKKSHIQENIKNCSTKEDEFKRYANLDYSVYS